LFLKSSSGHLYSFTHEINHELTTFRRSLSDSKQEENQVNDKEFEGQGIGADLSNIEPEALSVNFEREERRKSSVFSILEGTFKRPKPSFQLTGVKDNPQFTLP
jgi:hypothetical protein